MRHDTVIVEQVREGSVGKAQTTLERRIRDRLDAYLEASRAESAVVR